MAAVTGGAAAGAGQKLDVVVGAVVAIVAAAVVGV